LAHAVVDSDALEDHLNALLGLGHKCTEANNRKHGRRCFGQYPGF